MSNFKPGDRIRAVRDTTSQYGALIPKGATGTVIESAYADLAFRPDDSALGTARFIPPEDFDHEPAMQRVALGGTHIHTAHFEVGDVVVEVHPGAVVLERKPKPVTGRGTAYVFGMVPQGVDQRRYHGFLRDSGSFVFFDDEGAFSYALPDQYDGFEPDPKPE